MSHRCLSRRKLIASALAGGSAFALRNAIFPSFARADFDPDTGPLLVFCYFKGGWDQLLCTDPRNNDEYSDANGGVYPGYNELDSNEHLESALSDYSGGIIRPSGSNIDFGPAARSLAENHYDKLSVVRGIDMGTLTHEVGMRHFLTGKFPRGMAASGSAMPTVMVDQMGTATPIPNLTMSMESYNEGLAAAASALKINATGDLSRVLQALNPELTMGQTQADLVNNYVGRYNCDDERLDSDELVSTWLATREKAETLASGELFEHFDFYSDNLSSNITDLFDHFDIQPGNRNELEGAKGQAAVAAQALANGVSRAVSIKLASNLDHHDDDYLSDHYPMLQDGFDALSNLITFLEQRDLWKRTVLVCWSEFSRTPNLNSRGGRDHHLASSCILGGMGIRGNKVIGGTDDTNYALQPVDVSTGSTADDGITLTPSDVHATVFEAMGANADHLANNDPTIIDALIDS